MSSATEKMLRQYGLPPVHDSNEELASHASRPAWHEFALCRGSMQAGIAPWFPERGEQVDEAIAVCEQCPVMGPCREVGLERFSGYRTVGVWGGLSARQRRILRQEEAS